MKTITRQNSRADCHLFPTNILHSFEDAPFWISVSVLPASESTTLVRYDLFGNTEIKGELASAIAESVKAILHNIETGFQSVTTSQVENNSNTRHILEQLQEHARLEKKSGGQILPAMRQPKGSSLFQKAEQRKLLYRILHCIYTHVSISLQGNRLLRLWIQQWLERSRLVISEN
jgi:hypothetical protein